MGSKPQLVRKCKRNRLPTHGNKGQIVKRLVKHLSKKRDAKKLAPAAPITLSLSYTPNCSEPTPCSVKTNKKKVKIKRSKSRSDIHFKSKKSKNKKKKRKRESDEDRSNRLKNEYFETKIDEMLKLNDALKEGAVTLGLHKKSYTMQLNYVRLNNHLYL